MSATTVELLRVAGEIVGGKEALARRLGIGQALLANFMRPDKDLPDPLLLRAVDIILADRQQRAGRVHTPARDLSKAPGLQQNCADGGNPAWTESQ
jgi:hypothetical protein